LVFAGTLGQIWTKVRGRTRAVSDLLRRCPCCGPGFVFGEGQVLGALML